jgi:hypothetical protein
MRLFHARIADPHAVFGKFKHGSGRAEVTAAAPEMAGWLCSDMLIRICLGETAAGLRADVGGTAAAKV